MTPSSFILQPKDDGITHINAYSRGKTELGRCLSNFAECPFTCEDGEFQSIEGYWYWLSCPPGTQREQLRKLSGISAKKAGRDLRGKDWDETPKFRAKIETALEAKGAAWSYLRAELRECDLPITHYYVMRGKVIAPVKGSWVWAKWERLREEYQQQPWRVLICGDRDWDDENLIRQAIFTRLAPGDVVIHGAARGADSMAGAIAREFGLKVEMFPAQWDRHGRAAGPIRNQQMLDEGKPDEIWAFHWDLSVSKGTRDMAIRGLKARFRVINFDGETSRVLGP